MGKGLRPKHAWSLKGLNSVVCDLQVVGFAVFFALILKKVDEDEEELLDTELGISGKFFFILSSLIFYKFLFYLLYVCSQMYFHFPLK